MGCTRRQWEAIDSGGGQPNPKLPRTQSNIGTEWLLLYPVGSGKLLEVSLGQGNIGSLTPCWAIAAPMCLLQSAPAIYLAKYLAISQAQNQEDAGWSLQLRRGSDSVAISTTVPAPLPGLIFPLSSLATYPPYRHTKKSHCWSVAILTAGCSLNQSS